MLNTRTPLTRVLQRPTVCDQHDLCTLYAAAAAAAAAAVAAGAATVSGAQAVEVPEF